VLNNHANVLLSRVSQGVPKDTQVPQPCNAFQLTLHIKSGKAVLEVFLQSLHCRWAISLGDGVQAVRRSPSKSATFYTSLILGWTRDCRLCDELGDLSLGRRSTRPKVVLDEVLG
jgi:hypothetical protein